MSPANHLLSTIDNGAVLQVQLADVTVQVYVVISEPSLEKVADFLPEERFEADGDIHVLAVAQPEEASTLIDEVSQAINDDDTLVFLCLNAAAKDEVLHQFGISAGQATHH